MIRILVVDDHSLVRQGIAALLGATEGMVVVGQASTGMEAVPMCRDTTPDVVVMDVSMPDMNGVEATERIHGDCPEARVLGMSMHAEPSFVERMLMAGAAGYLLKNSPLPDLQAAVRAVAEGHAFFSPEVASMVLNRYVPHAEQARETLKPAERKILQLVAEGKSSKEIGEMLCMSVRTVEKHRLQIMKRLGLKNMAALIKYAIKEGFSTLDF
jgi:DNA-binding NarL/FixJ family response regulator